MVVFSSHDRIFYNYYVALNSTKIKLNLCSINNYIFVIAANSFIFYFLFSWMSYNFIRLGIFHPKVSHVLESLLYGLFICTMMTIILRSTLKLLFCYQHWIYEVRSIITWKTKLWLVRRQLLSMFYFKIC